MTNPIDAPGLSAGEARQRIAAELSLGSRLGYILLLLVAIPVAGVILALLLTEPALPLRTRVSFVVLVVIGVSWAAFAAWVLSRRRVLLGHHRILAGRMAVAFSLVFLAGALIVSAIRPFDASRAAVGVAVAMVIAAAALLVRAHVIARRLTRRRDEIERELRRS